MTKMSIELGNKGAILFWLRKYPDKVNKEQNQMLISLNETNKQQQSNLIYHSVHAMKRDH